MAGENALDGETDPVAQEDGAIDGAVGDLRGVLKKDAGEEPVLTEESVDSMGGAAALGSDFGADFETDDASTAADDPFNIGDAPNAGADDFAAPGLDGMDFGGDFSGAPDLDGPDSGAQGGGAQGGGGFGGSMVEDFGANPAASSGVKLGASGANSRADLVLGIPIDVQIILGSSRMAVSSLMNLSEGATIALDRKIGEPVEIMVNGKLIGRGEITVLETDDTKFAVKIIEVIGEPQKKSS
ncbi:flagellar motor switch protein FliN [Hoeflea sp. YIM 152468]|uniref:flagellar motor switch protein FliN n=1 Tax=Hoeflea sp. YIM 152468 TaxID=3031759 RepID=UPI0023DCCA77|nr:flagellar motor switch protein FliN [Hoeflea sp. YIM 152468]MDF1608846.1 flagellar motor switch protein FliN [Hoeflea sp. YIM 152468]